MSVTASTRPSSAPKRLGPYQGVSGSTFTREKWAIPADDSGTTSSKLPGERKRPWMRAGFPLTLMPLKGSTGGPCQRNGGPSSLQYAKSEPCASATTSRFPIPGPAVNVLWISETASTFPSSDANTAGPAHGSAGSEFTREECAIPPDRRGATSPKVPGGGK